MEFRHKSVLLEETIEGLNVKPDGIYVDGTLGGAGHAVEVCSRLSAKGRFIGIDQDQDAIIAASERLAAYEDRVTIIRSNYCYMVNELRNLGIHQVDGILLDLGVSSYQLDNEERGFTYRVDAPLDMRMDQRQTRTAADIINGYEEKELYRIIRDYGEDKFAKNIAKHIVAGRTDGNYPPCDSHEDSGSGRTSCKENLSGCPYRAEQRTGCTQGVFGRNDRDAGRWRKDLYYYIPFS